MAAPKVRISPSGPVATDEAPFSEYAGNLYAVSHVSTTEYVGKIGPSDAAGAFASSISLVLGDNSSPPTNNVALSVQNDDPVALGVGTWLVELNLSIGFATAPASTDDFADLNIDISPVTAAGVTLGSAVSYKASPLPRTGLGTFGGNVVHSTRIPMFVEITPAIIAANGGVAPEALNILLTRITGTVNGDYTTTSGWLEISKDTNVIVRRLR